MGISLIDQYALKHGLNRTMLGDFFSNITILKEIEYLEYLIDLKLK